MSAKMATPQTNRLIVVGRIYPKVMDPSHPHFNPLVNWSAEEQRSMSFEGKDMQFGHEDDALKFGKWVTQMTSSVDGCNYAIGYVDSTLPYADFMKRVIQKGHVNGLSVQFGSSGAVDKDQGRLVFKKTPMHIALVTDPDFKECQIVHQFDDEQVKRDMPKLKQAYEKVRQQIFADTVLDSYRKTTDELKSKNAPSPKTAGE